MLKEQKILLKIIKISIFCFLIFVSCPEPGINVNLPPYYSPLTCLEISCGKAHVACLKNDYTVWCWGTNWLYQLALQDDNIQTPIPTKINNITNIKSVRTGPHNSFAITDNGTIIAWGANNMGMLGIGTNTDTYIPTEVVVPDVSFMCIQAGESHTIALDSDHNVWVWGSNTYGQLGVPGLEQKNQPYFLDNAALNNKVMGIAAGDFHTMAIVDVDNDGTGDNVFCWGDNYYGEIGNGFFQNIQTFPFEIQDFSDIKKVAAGGIFSIALKSDGTVWTWGRNNEGQLGIGSIDDKNLPTQVMGINSIIIDIAGGYEHALALKEDGTLLAWGRNQNVQLGAGEDKLEPYYATPQDVLEMTDVVAIDAGILFSIAMKSNGTVWAWGMNTHGELGQDMDDVPYTLIPLKVPGLNY